MRLRPSTLGVVAAILTVAAATCPGGALAAGASWQFAPASAPPQSAGASAAVSLGSVGEISFWAPNRGLLIDEGSPGTKKCTTTSTTGTVPCGLYAYNGEGWHLLSTVCGGQKGRIAWAGPDEFWTISDQRPGQNTGNEAHQTHNVSLCHFLDGVVVGSYATPLGLPDSYKQMHAAACLAPTDCWFGGELGTSPNVGAFHLHWNGQSLTAVYSPQDHAVFSMALANRSTLFESVTLRASDSYESEDPAHPAVVHQIEPFGSNLEFPFHNVFMADASCEHPQSTDCPPLPNYEGVTPSSIAGFTLGSDYSESNPASQLWAVAGREENEAPHPIVMRYDQGEWTQFSPIDKALKMQEETGEDSLITGVAAEPGSPAAWVALGSKDEEAHVDRLQAEGSGRGTMGEGAITDEETLGEKQGDGKLGSASAITCPARNDCWLATSRGWLFHLTEDPEEPERTQVYKSPGDFYPVDNEGFAEVIAFRPPDEGIPQLPSIEPPPEESTALEAKLPPLEQIKPPVTRTSKPLVTNVSSHVVGRTLELSFRLTVKARVQLLADRGRRSVAKTAMRTLKRGRHTLMLRLNPRRWPTKLNLKATPLEPLPTVETKGSPSGSSPNAVAPPVGSNNVET